jgi:tetratricopeptide (TPR) repeat protein
MQKNQKLLLAKLLIGAAIFSPTVPAGAQMAENWNVVPHQRSEVKNSTGLTLLNKRKMEAAIDMFRKATFEDPSAPVPYGSLGVALAMQGRYQEALDALQKSYQLRQSGETLLSTGMVYYLMHDYDAAINSWNKILEANPRAGHVFGDIGFAFLRKGDFIQAEQFFDKLVKYYPHSSFGYHGLALTKYLEGDFRASRASAERAQLIYPYPPTLLLLAKLDFLQGDRARGTRRALQYNAAVRNPNWQQRTMAEIGYPPQHDAHWDPFIEDSYDHGNLLLARTLDLPKQENRRRSLARTGKVAQRIDELKKKLADHKNDYFLLHEMGLLQLADGDYSTAAETFEKVLQACPKCSVDMLHMARALALDGKTSQASAMVRQFRKIYPNDELAPALTALGQVDPNIQNAPSVTAPLQTTPEPKRAEQPGTTIPSAEF